MCGIYGFLAINGERSGGSDVLSRMGNAIIHRGPDDAGEFIDGPIALGMRRLSIIDVAGGHQPIANEDGSCVVVCNGEIYNFERLRSELLGKGHRFATQSDTEVIVHLYEEHGEHFLNRLEGMFGLALWDRRARRLIVARDPLGIKPVYHTRQGHQLAFASEIKALVQTPGVSAGIDPSALAQYLAVGYVAAPHSLFAGISKLPPGTALIVEGGRIRSHRYWQLPSGLDAARTEPEWAEDVRSGIERAVVEQMVSDVPIGAFLSGGLDSSSIVAFMSRHSRQPVKTYSIGFRDSSGSALYNELPHARTVARMFGTDHHEILVQPDVAALLPKLVWHLDEPIADAAFFTTFLVSEFARRDVTVILSGVGGDELFGGYTRYLDQHYRRAYRRVPEIVRRVILDPIARVLPSDRHSSILNKLRLAKAFILADALGFPERYARFMEVFSAADRRSLLRNPDVVVDDCIARAFKGTPIQDSLRQLMQVDLETQLAEDLLMLTDKMSMATSLECRVPLLDQQLVELAAGMPEPVKIRGGSLKHVMKSALKGVLPESILQRAKRGFGAPIGAWFKNELAGLVSEVLSPAAVERRGLFDPAGVQNVIAQHRGNREDRTDHLLALINLEMWCRLYLDGHSAEVIADELRSRLAA